MPDRWSPQEPARSKKQIIYRYSPRYGKSEPEWGGGGMGHLIDRIFDVSKVGYVQQTI